MRRRQMHLLAHQEREQETKVRILDSLSIFGFLTNHLDLLYLRKLSTLLIVVVLTSGLVSCSDRLSELPQLSEEKPVTTSNSKILEVSPPEIIQQLRQAIDIYQPQITIQSPQPDQMFEDNTIEVQLEVKDLPIFKSELDLGPYVEVILDNKPYKKIYDLNQSLILSDLEPGTHTLRIFACRPWDESFKNEGAYAQTTFHIFTKTTNNNPALNLPLLTYNSPLGDYGAEPIMLDYYLANAPSHLAAQEDPEDEIVDWRIRVTVNGTSFITDQWQSIYLQGFHPGKNWIKLEYIDDEGNALNENYNSTIHLINYQPGGQDTLSKIIEGDILLKEAYTIVDPEYIYEETQPEVIPELETEEIPATESEEIEVEEILIAPEIEEVPTTESEIEEILTAPEIEEIPATESEIKEILTAPEIEEIPTTESEIEEILTAPEIEEIPATESEEIEAEEALMTPEIEQTFTEEATSKIETTEANELPTTKEKIGEFVNQIRARFQGLIDKVTEKQKSETLDTIEKPNLEENFNPSEKSEVQDSLQENEFPSLPEIVEEEPTTEPVEKLPPQETPTLTPNVEESNESVETPSMSIPEVVEDFQQDNILESEPITESKFEEVVESMPTESDDFTTSIPEVVEDFQPEDTTPESEPITESKSEEVVESMPTESDDSTTSIPEVVEDFQPEDTIPESEPITESKSEEVVESMPTESDDSIQKITEEIESENTPDYPEEITE